MANLEFSVPFNHAHHNLEELLRLKRIGDNSIKEVYLAGPQKYSGSGRRTPEMSMDEFAQIVGRIHKEGIRVNLVMNPTCEGMDWYSPEVLLAKMEYLRQVHEGLGVEAVTIANPIYISEARERFPNLEIHASVLSDIDCVQRAVIYRKAGADIITPEVNINRDLKLLKEIKEATGAELKVMVNEGCLYKCPFRKFHFNVVSHYSKELDNKNKPHLPDFFQYCSSVIIEDNPQILKSGWIRPEDVHKYSAITRFFKVVDRGAMGSRVLRATRAYLEESWDGDLMDLLGSSFLSYSIKYGAYLDNKKLGEFGFFEKVTSCNRNCSQCNYCKNIINKLLTLGGLTKEKLRDMGRNREADELEKGKKSSMLLRT